MSVPGVFRTLQTCIDGKSPIVSFVRPIDSVVLAAARCSGIDLSRLQFDSGCESYAKNTGLWDVLYDTMLARKGAAIGESYSPLSRLHKSYDVDAANGVVIQTLEHNLGAEFEVQLAKINQVVGELHDNVASHANGVGFSAAQVYYADRIEFAVADAGCGLLHNVQKVRKDVRDCAAAIGWCLKKGNTTAKHPDAFAQHLPDDAMENPFGPHVETRSDQNHHMGHGLATAVEVVAFAGGEMRIITGDAQLSVTSARRDPELLQPLWHGVVIEITLSVQAFRNRAAKASVDPGRQKLAEKLGIGE